MWVFIQLQNYVCAYEIINHYCYYYTTTTGQFQQVCKSMYFMTILSGIVIICI